MQNRSAPIAIPPKKSKVEEDDFLVGSPKSSPKAVRLSNFLNMVMGEIEPDLQIPVKQSFEAHVVFHTFLEKFKEEYCINKKNIDYPPLGAAKHFTVFTPKQGETETMPTNDDKDPVLNKTQQMKI